jgi:hypothetical protein
MIIIIIIKKKNFSILQIYFILLFLNGKKGDILTYLKMLLT